MAVIWHCDSVADKVYELSAADFSVVRSAASPYIVPTGIGGDTDSIWHCDADADKVYELSAADFSVLRSAASPYIVPTGIGGDTDSIWHCDRESDKVYELSTTDFSVLRSAVSPHTTGRGIGGDTDSIWHCDADADKVYELSTTDFSVVRSAASPSTHPRGIGGDANTIWHGDADADKVYELSTTDFSVLRSADSPDVGPRGIGGTGDVTVTRGIIIAGIDRTADVKIKGFVIEQALTWEEDTCSFIVKSGDRPLEGEEVIVVDGGTKFFAGIIDEVKDETITSSVTWYYCKARDYTYKIDAKLVVETYENQSASHIFLDIAAKYCSGFTTNNVATGAPAVERIIFDYKRPSDCFKELCEYCGWDWYVDYNKDLHFFNPIEANQLAPVVIDSSTKIREFRHALEITGLRNRVYVRGGTMLSDPWTYETKADGTARQWWLPHKPHDISLTVGGEAKTVGVENVDEEADYDYMMNFQEKYIRCSEHTSTPADGATISVTYRYDIDVITVVEDVASQQAVAAVQGGDGVYEHVIVDETLTTIEAAEAAGYADLREHANPRVSGSFMTEITGWEPGQLVTIDLPDRGIQNTFLVQRVTITPLVNWSWTYHVEYGGRLLGIADWLQALWKAQQKKKLGETALLHKFTYAGETVSTADELVHENPSYSFKVSQGPPTPVCGFVMVAAQ